MCEHKALCTNPFGSVMTLDLSNQLLQSSQAQLLCVGLRHVTNLTLEGNFFGLRALRTIVSAVPFTSIQFLNLSRQFLPPGTPNASIFDLAFHCHGLRELRLSRAGMTDDDCFKLNPNLEVLDISHNHVSDAGIHKLRIQHLHSLNVAHNRVVGSTIFLWCLSKSHRLQHLDVSGNTIESVSKLAKCIRTHTNLESLEMRDVGLAFSMMAALSLFSKLERIDISENDCEPDLYRCFLNGLRWNETPRVVLANYCFNHVQYVGLQLEEAFRSRRLGRCMDCCETKTTPLHTCEIPFRPRLRCLGMRLSPRRMSCSPHVVASILNNSLLTSLDIKGWVFDHEDPAAVVLAQSPTTRLLDFCGLEGAGPTCMECIILHSRAGAWEYFADQLRLPADILFLVVEYGGIPGDFVNFQNGRGATQAAVEELGRQLSQPNPTELCGDVCVPRPKETPGRRRPSQHRSQSPLLCGRGDLQEFAFPDEAAMGLLVAV